MKREVCPILTLPEQSETEPSLRPVRRVEIRGASIQICRKFLL